MEKELSHSFRNMKKKISSYQRQTDLLDKMSQTERYVNNLTGISYIVLPKVYPGGTDSLLLCDCMDINKGDEVLDIGTGTGIVALKAKTLGACNVMAIDLSPRAISNVKQNAKYLGLKIDVKLASVFGKIKKKFNVITFNPPYTDRKAEKDYQICFWDKGNTAIKLFFDELEKHLKENGKAYVCWSSFAKKGLIVKLAKSKNFKISRIGKRSGQTGYHFYVYKVNR